MAKTGYHQPLFDRRMQWAWHDTSAAPGSRHWQCEKPQHIGDDPLHYHRDPRRIGVQTIILVEMWAGRHAIEEKRDALPI